MGRIKLFEVMLICSQDRIIVLKCQVSTSILQFAFSLEAVDGIAEGCTVLALGRSTKERCMWMVFYGDIAPTKPETKKEAGDILPNRWTISRHWSNLCVALDIVDHTFALIAVLV